MNIPVVRPKKHAAGREAIDGARNVQRVSITLEEEQRSLLRSLGGSAWVRSKIREAFSTKKP